MEPPPMLFVPKRNPGKSFEDTAKILRGLWLFDKHFGVVVAATTAGVQTLNF